MENKEIKITGNLKNQQFRDESIININETEKLKFTT